MRYLVCLIIFTIFTIAAPAQVAEKVSLLCNWKDTTGIRPHNAQYFNDVWGFVSNGKEYAAIGSSEGVHIIDVDNCNQVAFYAGNSAGSHIINRDHVVYRNYLYAICDQGPESRLQIFDVSTLPDSLHLVYTSSHTEITRAHDIYIDSAKAKLYVCIHSYTDESSGQPVDMFKPMSVFSLADPEHPTLLTHFEFPDLIHDVFVRNDTAYLSATLSGYAIADFSGNTSYQILGVLPDYDYKGYNHSSSINNSGIGVMADETFGMPLKVINTKEVNNIEVVATFSPRPGDTTCVPHNPFILNEDYVLVSHYHDGLQIYNISQPDSPYRVGYYDTYPDPDFKGYAGAWGCYPYLPSHRILVSDMQTGLYVLNADSALNLSVKDSVITKKPFSIYPNPATDKLTISLPETGDISLSVCDIQGRVILKQAISLGSVPNQGIELPLLRNCPMGMYVIHIIAGSNTYTGKFIKAQN